MSRKPGLAARLAALLVSCSPGLALAAPTVPAPAAPLAPERPLLEFRGNLLFDELVYRNVLHLPADTAATPATATLVARSLRAFLRNTGYDLASVRAHVEAGHIVVEVDEGRLDKIIVIGQGLVETIRFRMELSLPAGVFNRPALERQLLVLRERFRLNRYTWELVPAEVQEAHGVQFDELEPMFGLPGVRPGLRYQLHILIAGSPWSRGFAPDISLDSPEGWGGGGHYSGQHVFLDDDRTLVKLRLAAGSRGDLDTTASKWVLSRAFLEGRWYSPPLFTEALRPEITLRADRLSLQRSDLHLDGFNQASFSAGIAAGVFHQYWTAAIGGGVERRFIYGIEKAIGASPLVDQTPKAQTRPYTEARAEVTFNPEELRTDRKHRLNFEARYYTSAPSSGQALWLRIGYQRRVPLGWHEFVWSLRGTLLAGEVLFPDEESIGNHLHGAFGGSDFAQKLLGAGAELRYSLLRDVCKVGIFYSQVLYGSIDRLTLAVTPRTAGAGGPAIHVLIADEFEADVYLVVSWKPNGENGLGPAIELRQVF